MTTRDARLMIVPTGELVGDAFPVNTTPDPLGLLGDLAESATVDAAIEAYQADHPGVTVAAVWCSTCEWVNCAD